MNKEISSDLLKYKKSHEKNMMLINNYAERLDKFEKALEKCKQQRDGFISSRFLSENPPVKYKGEDIYFDNCAEILDKEIDEILKGERE